MPPLGDERLRHLGRAPQDDGGARQAGLQAHAAARNAQDVAQIVHQARHVLDLAADHGLFALGGRILPRLHHVQRADDGRQRVAQLVAEHGEDFVLGARGVLRALQQALVLGVALLQRAARQNLRGDVGGDRHQPLHAARQVVHRLDGELEPALGQAAVAHVQPHQRVGAGVAHVGAVGVVQPALRRGGSQLGKGLAVGLPSSASFVRPRMWQYSGLASVNTWRGPLMMAMATGAWCIRWSRSASATPRARRLSASARQMRSCSASCCRNCRLRHRSAGR